MDYDQEIEDIFSFIKENDMESFIKHIKDLEEKGKLLDFYKFVISEYNFDGIQQQMFKNDETLNIFARNFPKSMAKDLDADINDEEEIDDDEDINDEEEIDDDTLKSRIAKNILPNVLIYSDKFIQHLKDAIQKEDDELIKGIYDIFINLDDEDKVEIAEQIDERVDLIAQNIINQNYNKYSSEIVLSLLDIKKGEDEMKVNFFQNLVEAIKNKDDKMITDLYKIYMREMSEDEQKKIVKEANDFEMVAKKLISENYNEFSTRILSSLLEIYKRHAEKREKKLREQVNKIIEENYEKHISSIRPVFEEILFDYVDSKDELYGRKVVMFDENKKYTMNYDFFVRNLIYASYSFEKEDYIGQFLADKLKVEKCFLPGIIVKRKEKSDIFTVKYNENKVDFVMTAHITQLKGTRGANIDPTIVYKEPDGSLGRFQNLTALPDFTKYSQEELRWRDQQYTLDYKRKKIIDDLINDISKCSYGFQPLTIDIEGRKAPHAVFSFFEKMENNINIYYYDPHGTQDSFSYNVGVPEFLIYLVKQINIFYPQLNVKIDFKYSGCLIGLQSYTNQYDIGMCESWTLFWMFLVSKTLDYVKKNNLNLTIEQWLPLIEKYFTQEVEKKKIYNLLISFISQLYIEFNNKNKKFNNYVKTRLREYYLTPKFLDKKNREGIIIEDITGRELYELEKLKKEYKQYVNKLAVLKEDFYKRKEAYKKVKEKIAEEAEKVAEKSGTKIFEKCKKSSECSTNCCKKIKKTNICVPQEDCKRKKRR